MRRAALPAILLGLLVLAGLTYVALRPAASAPSPAPADEHTSEPSPDDRARRHQTPVASARERAPAPDAETGAIAGHVVRGGEPVPDVRVYLVGDHPDDGIPVADARTGPEGEFSFEEVPVATYRLVVRRDGDEPEDVHTAGVDVPADGTAEVTIPLSAASRVAGVPVRGIVRYRGTDDVPKRFRFELWARGAGDEQIHVTGVDGRLETRVPRLGEYVVSGVVADGEAHDRFWQDIVVAEGREVTIDLHAAYDTVLEVVDAVTGRPLREARAYRTKPERDHDWGFEPGHVVPGPNTRAAEPLRADSGGRIALGRTRGVTEWYVIADGYAWSAVNVLGSPAPTRAELRPGGSLRLVVERWPELDAAAIHARRSEEESPFRLPSPGRSGEVGVRGLLPGRHDVVVRRGGWWEDGRVYGQGSVEVRAGEEATLTIAADPGEVRPKVAPTGTIVVADGWRTGPRRLTFEGLEEANADVDETVFFRDPAAFEREIAFEMPPLPAGRYRVEVDPYQWLTEVDVSEAGPPLRFEVGAPGLVRVRVVDHRTRAVVRGASVSWFRLLPGQSSWSSESAPYDDETQRFEFQAPPGPLHLSGEAPGYLDNEPFEGEVQEVAPGATHDFELRLRPGGSVRALLRFGGQPFVAGQPWVRVSTERGGSDSGRTVSTTAQAGVATLHGFEPTTVRVSVERLPEYFATPEPQRVRIQAGETVEVVFDLERRP